jgi:hypothetical protein
VHQSGLLERSDHGDLTAVDLVDSCSIENCGVRRLEADEAIERAVNWKLSGRAEP